MVDLFLVAKFMQIYYNYTFIDNAVLSLPSYVSNILTETKCLKCMECLECM